VVVGEDPDDEGGVDDGPEAAEEELESPALPNGMGGELTEVEALASAA